VVKFLQLEAEWINVERIAWVHFFPGHNNVPTCTVHFGVGDAREYLGDQAEAIKRFLERNPASQSSSPAV